MKRIIPIAVMACVFNALLAFVIPSYDYFNMGLTNGAILLNTLLACSMYDLKIEETYHATLSMIFLGVCILEYISGLFAPTCWQGNWWLAGVIIVTFIQLLLLFFATRYSQKA